MHFFLLFGELCKAVRGFSNCGTASSCVETHVIILSYMEQIVFVGGCKKPCGAMWDYWGCMKPCGVMWDYGGCMKLNRTVLYVGVYCFTQS